MDATSAVKAVSNGNLTALLDTLVLSHSYTVSAVAPDGGLSAEIHVSGSTVVIAYGGDELALYAFESDSEAVFEAERAVARLATGWLSTGALVAVVTPDGRTVSVD